MHLQAQNNVGTIIVHFFFIKLLGNQFKKWNKNVLLPKVTSYWNIRMQNTTVKNQIAQQWTIHLLSITVFLFKPYI